MYVTEREYVKSSIEQYRVNIIDELACLFDFSDEEYKKRYMELCEWEHSLMEYLNEEQADESIITREKVDKELIEVYADIAGETSGDYLLDYDDEDEDEDNDMEHNW